MSLCRLLPQLTDRMGLPIREKNMKTSFLQKAYEVDVITSTWGPAFHTNSDTSVKLAQNLAAYTLDKYLWVNRMHRTPPATVGFLAPAERTHFWGPHMLAQPPHGHYPFFLLVHSVLCPSTHTLAHTHTDCSHCHPFAAPPGLPDTGVRPVICSV